MATTILLGNMDLFLAQTNGSGFGDDAGQIILESVKLLLILLAPFVVFALIIHWFERLSQRRLVERFGWRSVLWTGWLGTPIHELSHALMCRVFQHRVDEIALFEPDEESGRLGYVRHSFKAGNWFQELGNFFIGIAPLLGGSLVLAILLWLFYPDAASAAMEAAQPGSVTVSTDDGLSDDFINDMNEIEDSLGLGSSENLNVETETGSVQQMFNVVSSMCGKILQVKNLATPRFWVFIYLVLCVGSHMAPSPSDYHGASRGVFIFGGIIFAAVFLLALVGTDSKKMVDGMVMTMGPLFAVLGLAVFLVGITTAIVYLITSFIPRSYR
ncbi:MAG: hypothetical protein AB8B55_10760 [Mariniblastus sp.]